MSLEEINRKVIETRTAKVWKDDFNIIHASLFQQVDLTLDDAVENMEAITEIAGSMPCVLLSDIRKMRSASKEHRDFFSSHRASEAIYAGAILTNSPLSKVLGNLFIKINNPPYESKVFTSENEAMEWLKGFIFRENKAK